MPRAVAEIQSAIEMLVYLTGILFPEKFARQLIRNQWEVYWVLLGQALVFVGGFIGIKVLTNILGPGGYGQLALGLTIAGIIHMFVYGPVEQIVLRFVSIYREKGELGVLLLAVKNVHLVAAIIVLAIGFTATVAVSRLANEEWAWLVAIATLLGITGGINATFTSLQNAMRRRKIVALHQAADIWLRIGFSVILLNLFLDRGYVALSGYLMGVILVTSSQAYVTFRSKDVAGTFSSAHLSREKRALLGREFLRYGRPFTFFAVFAAVNFYADRWIIQMFLGESAVGIYTAMFQIGNAPILLLIGIVNQLFVPIIFERAGSNRDASRVGSSIGLLSKVVVFCGLSLMILAGASYFASETLLKMFTTSEFVGFHYLLAPLMCGLGLRNIGQLLVVEGMLQNRTAGYIYAQIIQTVSFLLVSFFFVGKHGMSGIVGALNVSSFLYLLSVLAVNRRIRVYRPISGCR